MGGGVAYNRSAHSVPSCKVVEVRAAWLWAVGPRTVATPMGRRFSVGALRFEAFFLRVAFSIGLRPGWWLRWWEECHFATPADPFPANFSSLRWLR